MSSDLINQAAHPSRPVRITMPASVAYNLPLLNKGIANLLGQLGCPGCCSGFDITFLHERNFVINHNLEVTSSPLAFHPGTGGVSLPQDPIPLKVALPAKASYDIKKVQKIVGDIAGKLGCPGCCSGFDITFLQERELLHERDFHVDEALNIHSH